MLVPPGIFKAVYDPERRAAAAYVVPNAAGNEWQGVSVAQLQQMTGIDVFPGLPEQVKATAMPLPKPTPYGSHRTHHERRRERY